MTTPGTVQMTKGDFYSLINDITGATNIGDSAHVSQEKLEAMVVYILCKLQDLMGDVFKSTVDDMAVTQTEVDQMNAQLTTGRSDLASTTVFTDATPTVSIAVADPSSGTQGWMDFSTGTAEWITAPRSDEFLASYGLKDSNPPRSYIVTTTTNGTTSSTTYATLPNPLPTGAVVTRGTPMLTKTQLQTYVENLSNAVGSKMSISQRQIMVSGDWSRKYGEAGTMASNFLKTFGENRESAIRNIA
jgi:hypothetical protein